MICFKLALNCSSNIREKNTIGLNVTLMQLCISLFVCECVYTCVYKTKKYKSVFKLFLFKIIIIFSTLKCMISILFEILLSLFFITLPLLYSKKKTLVLLIIAVLVCILVQLELLLFVSYAFCKVGIVF